MNGPNKCPELLLLKLPGKFSYDFVQEALYGGFN